MLQGKKEKEPQNALNDFLEQVTRQKNIGDKRSFVNICVFRKEASVLLVVSQNLPPDPCATYLTKIPSPGTK